MNVKFKSNKQLFAIFALICCYFVYAVPISAVIINVPIDKPTIQEGINSASTGDTVLVEPGAYLENIIFNGKNIIVASKFLITNDTSFISSTIIEAAEHNAVVRIISGENNSAAIIGFTITGGTGWEPPVGNRRGGGIYCFNSNPRIISNIIRDNSASYGGGIYCDSANPIITNNIVIDNKANNTGGGIWCFRSNALIKNNVIYSNKAVYMGGGIMGSYCNASIINNTIMSNYATNLSPAFLGGGAISLHNESIPELKNNIIWRNHSLGDEQILVDSLSNPQITYCLVEGGWSGDGNIDTAPQFSKNNFIVCSSSPCIDNGDPGLTDPDGSRSDIGYYAESHPDCIRGKVSYVSPSGDDVGGDGSSVNPYGTIQYAIDQSISADTVIVLNGTYYENLKIEAKSVAILSNYAFSNDSMDIISTIIDGDSAGIVANFIGCDSRAIIKGLTIQNGLSGSGSGVRCYFTDMQVSNNRILSNIAEMGAGGMTVLYCSPTITSNIISGNRVQIDSPAGQSGGIYFYHSNALLDNNIISENFAEKNGGGIYCHTSDLTITNNVFHGNTTYGGGGGISLHISDPVMRGNTIVNNTAGYGGGMSISSVSDPVVTNSIFWGNSADSIGNQINISGTSSATFSYCDIQGGWVGEGNFNLDPMFCDFLGNDYHINSFSPCASHNNPSNELIGALDISCGPYWGPVWYVATTGHDVTGDGSSEIPFRTIQHAVNLASKTDTILVESGTYYENVKILAKNIILASYFIMTGDTAFISSTIIDGNMLGPVLSVKDVPDSTAVISGFTIRNGKGIFQDAVNTGGGIHCKNSFLIIDNNRIINNGIIESTSGGGIKCRESTVMITNNLIANNASTGGGGISCNSSYALISQNEIVANQAKHTGGGISCAHCPDLKIIGNIIKENHAAETGGGGIYCQQNNPLIINNTIRDNTTDDFGAGIFCFINADPVIEYNLIFDNYSTRHGGGIVMANSSDPVVRNNSIIGNHADLLGGGIACFGSSFPVINNTIIWSNSADSLGSQIYVHDETTNPQLSYCDIQDGWDGEGNFNLDPMFCDTVLGDFHISSLSPCAANNNASGLLIGALPVNCGPSSVQHAYMDIKPGSCPNPVNIKNKSHGKAVIPVAILGTEQFDVHDIDLKSIKLEGVTPLRASLDDVAAPVDTDDNCNCVEGHGDGYLDLTLKFSRNSLIAAIENQFENEVISLKITGMLNDSTYFEGFDCIVIRPGNNIEIVMLDGDTIEVISAVGDFTGDGIVNILDITYFMDFLYRSESPQVINIEMGDLDNNTRINLLDITLLINYLFKDGPMPTN